MPASAALLLLLAAPGVRVWIGGDVHLGEGGRGVLAPLKPALDGAGIVNLEGAASPTPGDGRGLLLVNNPAAFGELSAAGIAVVGIANNHSQDAWQGGQPATARALRQAGLKPVGGVAGPALWQLDGVRIAVTAFDLTHGTPTDMGTQMARARERADLLIATFHVTGPALYLPSGQLREAVESALEAGAAVVAVHGSHEVGPVERRGKAVIAWGLGNVVFACHCTDEKEALILQLTLSRRGVERADVIPIAAGLGGEPARPVSPGPLFELLQALDSSPLKLAADRISF